MWNCKKCNHLMDDNTLICIDCGCPKQDIEINKQDYIINDAEAFSAHNELKPLDIKLVVGSKNEKRVKHKKNRKKAKQHNALMDVHSTIKAKIKKSAKKRPERRKFHLKVSDSPINAMNALKSIGILSLITYAAAGIVLGIFIDTGTDELFNWMVSSACWTMGAVTSVLFFGLSNIAKSIRDLAKDE